ncbi:MAG: hypothetical protein JKY96_05410, partial [Phycisphaerales bacterium]|nr:hypothetical protein [Phycisphaerales bacterium]
GADAAAHEHRSILLVTNDQPALLNSDEIVDRTRDDWQLVLNVDPDTNLDDEEQEIQMTIWRCIARYIPDHDTNELFCEVVLVADCIRRAEELAQIGAQSNLPKENEWVEISIVSSNRIHTDSFTKLAEERNNSKEMADKDLAAEQILWSLPFGTDADEPGTTE